MPGPARLRCWLGEQPRRSGRWRKRKRQCVGKTLCAALNAVQWATLLRLFFPGVIRCGMVRSMSAATKYYDLAVPGVKISLNSHAKEAPAGCNFEIVGWDSPLAYRKAAERLANYFRREFHYDFPQYSATEADFSGVKVMRDRVLMFGKIDRSLSEPNTRKVFYGAVCVRWIKWEDAPACWTLDWAWFHPYERRQGHLTRAWPHILQIYSNPWPRHPRSAAMKSFLEKMNFTHLMEVVADYAI